MNLDTCARSTPSLRASSAPRPRRSAIFFRRSARTWSCEAPASSTAAARAPAGRPTRELDAGDVDGGGLRGSSNELAHDARERDLDAEVLELAALALDELLEQRAIARAQAQRDEDRRAVAPSDEPFAGLFTKTVACWMYPRATRSVLWPVCRMIASSGRPFSAAVVMNPDRSECPP